MINMCLCFSKDCRFILECDAVYQVCVHGLFILDAIYM